MLPSPLHLQVQRQSAVKPVARTRCVTKALSDVNVVVGGEQRLPAARARLHCFAACWADACIDRCQDIGSRRSKAERQEAGRCSGVEAASA